MRAMVSAVSLAALIACSPPIPDSAPQGVGFENYDTYIQQKRARDAELSRSISQNPVRPPEGAEPPLTPAQQTAADAVTAISPRSQTTSNAPLDGRVANRGGAGGNNAAISDEQDFGAVTARQTIQSDAERRAAQSAQYRVVKPTALPSRPKNKTPTPIEFALQVSHPVGQKVYKRPPFGGRQTTANCAAYGSSDLAQEAFLNAGGPSKDKLRLDPDGDGYACSWNPARYRQLVRR